LKTAFVYTDRYFEYDYGWSHPLKIERVSRWHKECKVHMRETVRFLESNVFPLIKLRVTSDEQ